MAGAPALGGLTIEVSSMHSSFEELAQELVSRWFRGASKSSSEGLHV
jgi:hypothetical protein